MVAMPATEKTIARLRKIFLKSCFIVYKPILSLALILTYFNEKLKGEEIKGKEYPEEGRSGGWLVCYDIGERRRQLAVAVLLVRCQA